MHVRISLSNYMQALFKKLHVSLVHGACVAVMRVDKLAVKFISVRGACRQAVAY